MKEAFVKAKYSRKQKINFLHKYFPYQILDWLALVGWFTLPGSPELDEGRANDWVNTLLIQQIDSHVRSKILSER